jgi:hypothetical protein
MIAHDLGLDDDHLPQPDCSRTCSRSVIGRPHEDRLLDDGVGLFRIGADDPATQPTYAPAASGSKQLR